MRMQRSIAANALAPRIRGAGVARLVASLVIAALVAGCKGEAAVQEQPARPVKVAIVAAAPQGRTLSFSGVVRPRIESALSFRVPGQDRGARGQRRRSR